MPYLDVQPDDQHFEAIQRIGATGMLRGKGIPYKWANQTWFYPDTIIGKNTFLMDIKSFDPAFSSTIEPGDLPLQVLEAITVCAELSSGNLESVTQKVTGAWANLGLEDFNLNRSISRRELAVLLDHIVDPFHQMKVNWDGSFEGS